MRLALTLLLLLTALGSLRADGDAAAAQPIAADGRKVSAGLAYGANTFAGIGVGAIVGAAIEAIPYAKDRHGQDPNPVILGAVYGSVAGAVGLGLPLSAYEVASDKPGAGITVLYTTLSFSVLGGAVGAGSGMLSYRHKVDQQPQAAEDFLAAAAGGICAGGLLGLGVGFYEAVLWKGHAAKIPGSGIHAQAGMLAFSPLLDFPQGPAWMPNATLVKVDF